MAAPRVFISSTYYDLKHVRNDIGDFIRSLGYTPVMHDRGGVAYTQTDTIENSCYSELTTCDIVICIIGNHFGTQASTGDFSITMEELRTAIKNKKKIYIFIAKDVYIKTNYPAIPGQKRSRCRSNRGIIDSPTPLFTPFCRFRYRSRGQIYSHQYPRTSSTNDPFLKWFSYASRMMRIAMSTSPF